MTGKVDGKAIKNYFVVNIFLISCLILFITITSSAQELALNTKKNSEATDNSTKSSELGKSENSGVDNSDTSLTFQSMMQNLVEDNNGNNLSISGFLDLNYFSGGSEKSELTYGQFEVDFSAALYDGLSFEAALALDGESIVPGAGYLDYHFSGPEEGHNARGGFFTHSGIHAGQFDVPFGKYYEQIPSPSRNISTIPFVIQNSINCLNTFGVNVYTNYSILQANAFALNGIKNGYILGGRIGLDFSDMFVIGTSLLNNFDEVNDNTTLVGLDICLNTSIMEIGSEFIWGNGIADCEYEGIMSKHFGYYVESKLLTSNLTSLPIDLILRYGNWKSEKDITDQLNNITHFDITLDWLIHEQLTLKLEHHKYFSDGVSNQSNFGIQTVISF